MSRYSKGADFERAVVADLVAHGYHAIRAAGSHGIADIVALRDDIEPWLVQCKTDGRMGPKDRGALAGVCEKVGAIPVKASRPRRGSIRYERLLPSGEWDEVNP